MKSQSKPHRFQLNLVKYLIIIIFISGSAVFAANEADPKRGGDVKMDGLTVMSSIGNTEIQSKKDVDWSAYTKYQITPVDVSFRKNWKRDYNREKLTLSGQITDKDMAKIRESVGNMVYEEFDKALQTKGGLTRVDEADSITLLFKPEIINLDVYAPDVRQSSVVSKSYIRQVGKATLVLEVHDAVSGEILTRWVDTREDPDYGYYEWANRVTNIYRAKQMVRIWANRLVEGLEKMKTFD